MTRHLSRLLLPLVACVALLSPARGEEQPGCCQYRVDRSDGTTERRCENTSRDACRALRPLSSFLDGLECDPGTNRCVRSAPVPTATPEPAVTATPTPTATARKPEDVIGCCQHTDSRRPDRAVCAEAVRLSDCLDTGDAYTIFCIACRCSAATDGFAPGACIDQRSTPTPTPTRTPESSRLGCCQLDDLRRVSASVCGNAISEESCLNGYAGNATFCADCVCSSHDGPGFDLAPGRCISPTVTPTRTPTPQPQTGCCEITSYRGGAFSICSAGVSATRCLSDRRGVPRFCPDCTCSARAPAADGFGRGACESPRRRDRPQRPGGTHIVRPPLQTP